MENPKNDEKTVVFNSNLNKGEKTVIENSDKKPEVQNNLNETKETKEPTAKPELPKNENKSGNAIKAAAGIGLGAAGLGAGVYFSDEIKDMVGLGEVDAPESPEEEALNEAKDNENGTEISEVKNEEFAVAGLDASEKSTLSASGNENIFASNEGAGAETFTHNLVMDEDGKHIELSGNDVDHNGKMEEIHATYDDQQGNHAEFHGFDQNQDGKPEELHATLQSESGDEIIVDAIDNNNDGNFENIHASADIEGEHYDVTGYDQDSDGNMDFAHVEKTDLEGNFYEVDLTDHDSDGQFDTAHYHAVAVDGSELEYNVDLHETELAGQEDYSMTDDVYVDDHSLDTHGYDVSLEEDYSNHSYQDDSLDSSHEEYHDPGYEEDHSHELGYDEDHNHEIGHDDHSYDSNDEYGTYDNSFDI